MTAKRPVLVVGSLNVDWVVSTERLPNKGETVLGKEFATFPGGKGANQAVAASKLGASVFMVGCVGQDSFGEQLVDSLNGNHVQTMHIRRVHTATGTAVITVDDNGANTIVVVGGANQECCSDDVDNALAILDQPGILLVQNEVPQQTVEYAIKTAKSKGWIVIVNPAPARPIDESIMSQIDIIMPNETEAALLTNSVVTSLADAKTAAEKLLATGVQSVIITLGASGAVSRTAAECDHMKSFKVAAVDTTAAGDCYAGALAAGMAEGKTLKESMAFAAAAAALSVTKAGAQPSLPWRHEVDEFIMSRGFDQ